MKLRYVLAIIFCLGFNPLMSAEEVIIDYSYNGNHNTDFSSISVSLKIENVMDDRGSDPRLIADEYLAEKFSKDSVVTLWKEPDNTLNRGAFLPIFSSFRIFEEKGMFDLETMKKAWNNSGHEIILKLLEIVEERESITEVGKDSISWGFIAASWNNYLGKTR